MLRERKLPMVHLLKEDKKRSLRYGFQICSLTGSHLRGSMANHMLFFRLRSQKSWKVVNFIFSQLLIRKWLPYRNSFLH